MALLLAASVGVLVAPAAAGTSADWPTFQGGPSRPGTVPGIAIPPFERGSVLDRSKDQGPTAPVVVSGGVAVAVNRDRVSAFDVTTGAIRWAMSRDRGTLLAPVIEPAAGIVLYTEGTVRRGAALAAVDVASGRQRWRARLSQPATSTVAVADGLAVLGLRGGRLAAYELSGGSLSWSVALDGTVAAAPAFAAGRMFVVSENAKTAHSALTAVDIATHRRLWTFRAGGLSPLSGGPTVAGRTVYAPFGDSTVRAFDAATGRLRWSSPVRADFSPNTAAVVSDGKLLVNDRFGGLFAFDPSTGARTWDYQFRSTSLWGAPLVAGRFVCLGLDDGTIAAVDVGTGRLAWDSRLRFGAVGALTPAGDAVLASLLGRDGGVAVFHHGPGALAQGVSPSTLNLTRGILDFVVALAVMLVLVMACFRFLLRGRTPEPPAGTAVGSIDEPVEVS